MVNIGENAWVKRGTIEILNFSVSLNVLFHDDLLYVFATLALLRN